MRAEGWWWWWWWWRAVFHKLRSSEKSLCGAPASSKNFALVTKAYLKAITFRTNFELFKN
jgi:hypothetical protein